MAKNLQRRCRAIRTAIAAYNKAARALDPPRPTVDFEKVSHFTFLEEFSLLEDTRKDVREKPWAQPLVREAMRNARKVRRAREELDKVHIQARRLHTSIRDEELLFNAVLADLDSRQDPLHHPVLQYATRRRGVNASLMARLTRLYSLPGYSGDPTPGVHAGPPREVLSIPIPRGSSSDPASTAALDNLLNGAKAADVADDDAAEGDIDEDEHGNVSALIEHIGDIAVV